MMSFSIACVMVASLLLYSEATLTSSPPVACPDDTVTFICSLPSDMDVNIIWTVTPPPGLNEVGVNGIVNNNDRTLTIGASDMFMFRAAYSGLDGGMVTSTLTTLSMVTALAGAMVQCEDLGGARGGPIPIGVANLPSPPLNPLLFSNQNQLNMSIITLEWDSPSSTGGVFVRYVLTISPTPLSGSPVTVDTTSAQITISYNTLYNVTIRADNCAGMSNASILTTLSIVSCSSSPSTASGVVNVQTPSVPTVGSKLNFGCSGDNQMRTSTCGSNGRWNPDPEDFTCPTVEPPVTCPVPVSPTYGSVSTSGQSYTEGSQVTYQCNDGLFPMGVLIATCTRDRQNGVWEPDLSAVVCRTLPINCTVPDEPSNGTIVNFDMLKMNKTVLEGTVLTYQCDNELLLTGPNTITCTNAGVWSTEPEAMMCVVRTEASSPTPDVAIGPIVGGVVGGILVTVFCLIVVVIIALFLLRRQKSDELNEDVMVEMSGLQGDYSELRHDGPRNAKKPQPPPPDSEGYSRVNRSPDAGALTYDEVVLNSDNKIGVNSEGYSTMNTGQTQRLPGYGQLGNVATVEPVVYAALSSSQPHKKGKNTTATVDQHQVTYATVDVAATSRKQAKAATLPTSPTASAPALPDVDKLLDIDQALVQIRSMDHKWRELAETMRLPETMIEQIEDSCGINNSGCLTEVIDQWMRNCSGRPTWRELAGHLHNIGEEQLSQELLNIYNTGRLPVELNMKAVPSTVYKYDRAPPPPIPSRSPTMTDDSPGQSKTLPPSRPPKAEMTPVRPPKPIPKDESPLPPRPPKHYAKH